MKEKAKELKNKAMNMVQGASNKSDSRKGDYTANFAAPGSLSDGSDPEDGEDDEDVGKDMQKGTDLNYDSDEKDEVDDNAQTELISLDTNQSKKKNVPKLRKPK